MAYPISKSPIIFLAVANDDGRSLRYLNQELKEIVQIFHQVEKEGKCKIKIFHAATAAGLAAAERNAKIGLNQPRRPALIKIPLLRDKTFYDYIGNSYSNNSK